MTAPDIPKGVLPVLQTPFNGNGEIDEPTLVREIDWAFGCGVHGLTVAMVSEILRMDHRERRQLSERVCSAASGRGPVVVSVGAESTRSAVELARHAESVGAAAVMAIPPLTVQLGDGELIRYFMAISEAITLPLVIQDASSYVGSALSVELLARLHGYDPGRICFKPETLPVGPRLSALLDATHGAANVYDGSGGIALIDTFRRGIVGTMPGTDLCWALVRLWSYLKAGDYETAYRLSQPLVALVAMQTSLDAYVAVEKYLLVQQNVFVSGACREPSGVRLDDDTMHQIDAYFRLLTSAFQAAAAP
jgi:dihydrodipicolinate synthase/N-acetylneuraminate lyase